MLYCWHKMVAHKSQWLKHRKERVTDHVKKWMQPKFVDTAIAFKQVNVSHGREFDLFEQEIHGYMAWISLSYTHQKTGSWKEVRKLSWKLNGQFMGFRVQIPQPNFRFSSKFLNTYLKSNQGYQKILWFFAHLN